MNIDFWWEGLRGRHKRSKSDVLKDFGQITIKGLKHWIFLWSIIRYFSSIKKKKKESKKASGISNNCQVVGRVSLGRVKTLFSNVATPERKEASCWTSWSNRIELKGGLNCSQFFYSKRGDYPVQNTFPLWNSHHLMGKNFCVYSRNVRGLLKATNCTCRVLKPRAK